MIIEDGIIEPGSIKGKEFDYGKNHYSGYLWKKGDIITISFIQTYPQGKGYLSKLITNIISRGYKCQVPTPFARMRAILEKKKFVRKWVYDEYFGCDVEIYASS